jgi:predicted acyltransferase
MVAGLMREAVRGPTTAGQVVALPVPPSASPHQRLLSLDFLRGFTMFWIIGGREFVLGIVAYYRPPLTDAVETQLTHATWKGFVAWDMVMPVFLFLVGAAMPLALAKRLEPGQSLKSAYWRIARRVAVLWILGMFTQWMKYRLHLPELYSNTLQAIAVGYLVTSLALLHLRLPGQIVLLASLLVGYWALLVFVPFGGYSAGTLERTANFARYVDEKVLDVFRRDHSFTWVVTSLGFSASVLLGAMAGHLLRARLSVSRRLLYLLLAGFGCMAGGWVWSYSHPLNRHLWTSSMVLWAGGWSFLLLALSHAVIDVWGVRRWTYPFIVIGANALLAYVLDPVFDWRLGKLLAWVFPAQLPTISADLLTSTCELALLWLILWWLYRHRLFLRA